MHNLVISNQEQASTLFLEAIFEFLRFKFTSAKKYCIPVRFIKRESETKWYLPVFFCFDMPCDRVRCELYVYGSWELCYKKWYSHVWILIDWDLAFPVSLLILCQLRQCWDKCLLTFTVSVCPCETIWERLHDRLFRTAFDQRY